MAVQPLADHDTLPDRGFPAVFKREKGELSDVMERIRTRAMEPPRLILTGVVRAHLDYAARLYHETGERRARDTSDVGTGATPLVTHLKNRCDESQSKLL
ncbi:MAG: hypothetical protein AAGB02_02075 [Pseudomonadota bacterium]